MSLLYYDGFDHLVTLEDIQKVYTTALAAANTTTNTAFGRGRALRVGPNTLSRIQPSIPPQAMGSIIGASVRFRANTLPNVNGSKDLLAFCTATTRHVRIETPDNSGLLRLRTANGQFRADAVAPLLTGIWYHLEVKCSIHDTTGFVEVRLNGNTVLTFSGDTRDGGTGIVDSVMTGVNNSSIANVNGEFDFDDFVIWNAEGSENNDWLGDCEVQTTFATANDTITGWAPNTGTAWGAVSDASEDGDTTHIASNTVGSVASFVMGDLTTTPTKVLGVQLTAIARKSDSGNRSIRLGVDSNGEVAEGPETALGLTYAGMSALLERNPDGNVPWTPASFNAAKARVRVAV